MILTLTPIPIFSFVEIVGATIIAFVLGFASGFIVARATPAADGADIRLRIAIFITFVWAVSVIATIVVNDYETSIWVHGIMGGICGYLFGIENPLTGGGNNG